MNFLQPWLWYLLSALIMCVVYCGLEKANNDLGLTAKSVLCIWSILSLLITFALFGMQEYINVVGSLPPLQISGITIGACIITLCISSSCVYSAA